MSCGVTRLLYMANLLPTDHVGSLRGDAVRPLLVDSISYQAATKTYAYRASRAEAVEVGFRIVAAGSRLPLFRVASPCDFECASVIGMAAIWISKFLGPIVLVLSVPMVLAPERLLETTRRALADRPLILITGILAMVAGISIVNTHNVWVLGWPLIVTLFGWALVISGAARIVAPRAVDNIGGAMLGRPIVTRIAGVVWGSLGAFLTYQGYG